MALIGRVFGWKKGSTDDEPEEPAPGGVLDEDRDGESLTPDDEDEVEEKPFYFKEWPEEFPKVPAFVAEKMQRERDRKRNTPVALASLAREEQSMDLILEGLRQHYIECLLAGRLDVWARAAHAAVDLLSTPAAVTFYKRAA